MLGMEENARLREQVTRQEEGLSILENTCLDMYLFRFWLMSCFFLSLAPELVVLLPKLGGRVGPLERELETAKAVIGRSVETLAKSLEERRALEGELDQLRNVAQVVISEVFGSTSSTSTPTIRLVEVPDEVWELITDGMFYRTLGVLTLVATHHSDLDFTAIYSGYADG